MLVKNWKYGWTPADQECATEFEDDGHIVHLRAWNEAARYQIWSKKWNELVRISVPHG